MTFHEDAERLAREMDSTADDRSILVPTDQGVPISSFLEWLRCLAGQPILPPISPPTQVSRVRDLAGAAS